MGLQLLDVKLFFYFHFFFLSFDHFFFQAKKMKCAIVLFVCIAVASAIPSKFTQTKKNAKRFLDVIRQVRDRDLETDQAVSPASLKRLAYWQASEECDERPEAASAAVTHGVPLSFTFSSDQIRHLIDTASGGEQTKKEEERRRKFGKR